ncbi:MAG: fumarylacetoacetate hydrolase family protein [Candidatus Hodarchaeales archaeon]|jgi:2-keto-4-pentenoate hydratase/2-oxohepta-3-ene-1,7-dioic acid hydratase in catechol pathway
MRLGSFIQNDEENACLIIDSSIIPITDLNNHLNKNWPIKLLNIIQKGFLEEIKNWYNINKNETQKKHLDLMIPITEITYCPLYRNPNKIWGIGLNYKDHAKDLSETSPKDIPASFMKPTTTIIGFKDTIKLPRLSQKTTGEAELGIIIGKKTSNIEREYWLDSVAGFTNIIDMTAEDILRKNPRYLTVCKSFDTFFSFGPQLITPDEIPDVVNLNVKTKINGKLHRKNVVSNMTFPPDFLVSFHSKVMTLLPGDIISSGTPGAIELKHGDQISCVIDGFPELTNKVEDLKLTN